jgi:peptidoglycan/xylan/chitin deacetylase (PgdA/CDA1 family)
MGIGPTLRLCCLAASLALSIPAAAAEDCPGKPNALGTHRTIVVDAREHGRIGTMNYSETLPLVDKEVVLTFDDGPMSPYTDRVLDILATQCVRATYFIVGRMAKAKPGLVRRIHQDGHTVGTHSMNHPYPFRGQGLERAKIEIEDGIAATAAALGDDAKLAPFFRFPGLGRTDPVEDYLGARGLMIWSADFPADDWRRIGAAEIVRRALSRLEAKGKGILLLHDTLPATALALPTLLAELKLRGYRIVHVVPASAGRPKTPTLAAAWRLHPRAKPAMALYTIGEVLNPAGDRLAGRSPTELCSLLRPPQEPAIAVAGGRRPKRARMAQMPVPDIHALNR